MSASLDNFIDRKYLYISAVLVGENNPNDRLFPLVPKITNHMRRLFSLVRSITLFFLNLSSRFLFKQVPVGVDVNSPTLRQTLSSK